NMTPIRLCRAFSRSFNLAKAIFGAKADFGAKSKTCEGAAEERFFGTGRMTSHCLYRVSAGVLGALALGLVVNIGPERSWAAGESDFLAGKTKSCPGCSLPRAGLKRKDLSEADLSGADLTGAVLHRAR